MDVLLRRGEAATQARMALVLELVKAEAPTFDGDSLSFGTPPMGFHKLRRTELIGSGPALFERASTALVGWQLHRGAGLLVRADERTATVGVDVVSAAKVGPVRVLAPCRVIERLDEPTRQGFVYATLPGHPECGLERFVVERTGEQVSLLIEALSRPGNRLTALGGPVSRAIQGRITTRYFQAARRS
jgi:uncharacterized protein (UPF0548 family)